MSQDEARKRHGLRLGDPREVGAYAIVIAVFIAVALAAYFMFR